MRPSGFALVALGSVGSLAMISPGWADSPLRVVYPPADHQTTAAQIFLIGTADPGQPVLLNGIPVEPRSPAGHFAPSLPLELGPNRFTFSQGEQTLSLTITRVPDGSTLPDPPGLVEASLVPPVDIQRQPNELVCLGAIAPANATVTANLAGRTHPLLPQVDTRELPPNSAVLTQQTIPLERDGPIAYEGCFWADQPGNLGRPTYQMVYNQARTTATAPGTITILSPTGMEVVEVTAAAGVARTGPSTDYSRLTPLPQGTRARITGREGDWLRLDYGGWIRAAETRIVPGAVPPRSLIRGITSRQIPGWTEVYFPLQVPVPLQVNQTADTLTLTLHHTIPQTDTIYMVEDGLIERLDWQPILPDRVEYQFRFQSRQQWGYKLRYEGTTLVLSLKHGPVISRDRPLQGTTILVDPGHGGDELGALGPDGTPEKAVNLEVALLLQAELEARGATVVMTRIDDSASSPNDRAAQINRDQPTLALSLHYNALPDGGDALNTAGIGTFWYHPQAHNLAQFLHDYLVAELERPSYGVYWNNLALTRPHGAPSVLLELGFMINPFEFEWITNPEAQQQLAATLADGVAEWMRQAISR
ncbi:MAG TPA: N-acetylmuramoyl-L-alanine amidase [Leptolyngbyaceae cyanobacterium M65_K2018_010]|nr:N-acetylmuramoyl-L-alanine amidase [Leptolyngbyaceae cyanobacterium M65_K2018_010]